MKVYIVKTYYRMDLVGVQWIKDEQLAEVLKRNEYIENFEIEVEELELEDYEVITEEKWSMALENLNKAYRNTKRSTLDMDNFSRMLKIENLQIRYESGERSYKLYKAMVDVF